MIQEENLDRIRLIKNLTEKMNVIHSSEGRPITVVKSTSISTRVNGSNTSPLIRSTVRDHCGMQKEKLMEILVYGPQSTCIIDLFGVDDQ
jgi:hypothetical protein